MDEVYIEPLLHEYDWEKMNPKERWEQDQLKELEGFIVLEQLQLIQDEIEQLHQIDAVQKLTEEAQQHRNNDELIESMQWEHIAFSIQQLNQN